MEGYILIIYGLLGGWTIFSAYYIYNFWKSKDSNNVIPSVYESIPTVFTTLGVLGTFLGIYFGLKEFKVTQITESIPTLLDGLKTAFVTSIWGISLSLIFGKISQVVLNKVELEVPPKATDELAVLNDISTSLNLLKDGQLTQNEISEKIFKILGGNSKKSLLNQFQKLREEQAEYIEASKKNVERVINSMNKNNELLQKKFDEFSELLAKNNTEALVEVMKSATEQFNTQMSALIEKLVQENFQELNNSVNRMNKWQQENKKMISDLTSKFNDVSKDFEVSSVSIKEITENTNKLTDENSHLTKLIKDLQKVMIDDTKFSEITSNLTNTVEILKENTEAFDDTTNKLNEWIKSEHNFKDSVEILIDRLREIEKIKDINGEFWKNTETQLNKGLGVITQASNELRENLDEVNNEFKEQLNQTLVSLDELIQRIIADKK